MTSSIGMIIDWQPNIWENKKWQPNQQPEYISTRTVNTQDLEFVPTDEPWKKRAGFQPIIKGNEQIEILLNADPNQSGNSVV